MLTEWISWLTTPVPRHLRRMGYLGEQIALAKRSERCRAAWASHLDQCKKLIIEAINAAQGRKRAVVLGSGIQCDLPLAELSRSFEEVVLVDLLHLPAARRQARLFPNLRLVAADVTGVIEPLYHAVRGGASQPLPMPPQLGDMTQTPWGDVDLVASVNLLSQLPLLASEYAAGHYDPNPLLDFSQSLIQHHLAMLSGLDSSVCLITETERQVIAADGTKTGEDPLVGVRIGNEGWREARGWTWDLAPPGERYQSRALRLEVRGFIR